MGGEGVVWGLWWWRWGLWWCGVICRGVHCLKVVKTRVKGHTGGYIGIGQWGFARGYTGVVRGRYAALQRGLQLEG